MTRILARTWARALIGRLRDASRTFWTAQNGNVALTFGLAIIPLMAAVGAAVDYSRANSAKTAMQAAVDSTALMLSKDAQGMTQSQLKDKANAYFKALFNRTEVSGIVITPTFTSPEAGSFKLDVAGTGTVPTAFGKLIGQSTLDIKVNSEVLWGIKKLELALALDNTGSMNSNSKMTELKKAAHALLDTLKKAAKTPGDIKVAIIPFDTSVNLGTSYKDQPWFDIDSIDCNGWQSGSGCNKNNWKDFWDGCVRDRAQPYDVQDTSPTEGTTKTLFPVHDCGTLTKLMPLSTDWNTLNTKIDAMTPNGNTNVTIGLVWAWHALTTNTPLTEAAAPAPDLDKVIVLLTDGDNTESWDNTNNKKITSQTTIDARTEAACTNIKAANIRIYTVRVIDGNATLLKNCASKPTMYFDVQNATQLNSVFTAIAQSLANLRIAK
jgi:Flp pilus assembly protein TadG